MKEEKRDIKKLRTGFEDKLIPLESLDLRSIKTVNDMVKAMEKTAFGARQLGEAADILYQMTNDKECYKVLTLSGAMTVAKMGLVVCDMIEYGMVDAIVSTGALITHGFIQSLGKSHFKYDFDSEDKKLYLAGYDRVYDTIELEKNLDDAETIVDDVLSKVPPDEILCSHKICAMLGEYLDKNVKGRGILKSAYQKKVPVFIPAFTDSELGLDVAIYNRKLKLKNKKPLQFNPFLDLEEFADTINKQKRLGIFTVGGGVPRNWAQQVAPYLDIIQSRVGQGGGFKRYKYAVRICPEPAYWGGLSGCTYSEGVSWGKITPKSEGGRWAEVMCDATIAWPLIVKAVMERLEKK